jgi:hypothetical protein
MHLQQAPHVVEPCLLFPTLKGAKQTGHQPTVSYDSIQIANTHLI